MHGQVGVRPLPDRRPPAVEGRVQAELLQRAPPGAPAVWPPVTRVQECSTSGCSTGGCSSGSNVCSSDDHTWTERCARPSGSGGSGYNPGASAPGSACGTCGSTSGTCETGCSAPGRTSPGPVCQQVHLLPTSLFTRSGKGSLMLRKSGQLRFPAAEMLPDNLPARLPAGGEGTALWCPRCRAVCRSW